MPSDQQQHAHHPERSSDTNSPAVPQPGAPQQPVRHLFTRRQYIQLGLAGLVSLAGGAIIVSEVARRYGLMDSSLMPVPERTATPTATSQSAAIQQQATATNIPTPDPTARPSTTSTPQPTQVDVPSNTPESLTDNPTVTTPEADVPSAIPDPPAPTATSEIPETDVTPTTPDPLANVPTSETPVHPTGLLQLPKPPIITHAEWGGVAPTMPFTPHQIERITLHHEGVYFDGSMPAAEYIRQVQRWCLTDRMWPDIPYHFMIDLEGLIYEGRPLDAQGDTNTEYNTAGHAQVAVLGKYDAGEQVPTAVQIESVIAVMAWIASIYTIPPDADHIKGHRDYIPFDPASGYHVDTRTGSRITCPGDNLYIYLTNGTIHNGVAEKLARG